MSVKKAVTGGIYKAFVGVINILPFKNSLVNGLKKLGVNPRKYLFDIKLKGFFPVDVEGKTIYMQHQDSSIEKNIFAYGLNNGWEKEVTWIWVELAKKSNVILDIGANTGIFTMLSCAVNPKARVFAFEPSKNIFNKLSQNINKNKFTPTLLMKAVSNQNGIQTFYDFDFEMHTSASLNFEKITDMQEDSKHHVKTDVETVTLDKFCVDNNIDKIDLLKIDVEMHEPEVLEGYQQLIYQHMPVIFIEILKDSVAEKIYKLVDFNRYEIFHFADYKRLEVMKEFKAEEVTFNYLLIPKEKVKEVQQWIS